MAGRLPQNRPKSSQEHKGRCVTHLSAPSREARIPRFFRVFCSVRPRRGRTQTDYFPGPQGRGRLEDYSLSWPGGPGRRKTICGYVPFLAQHWAYGSIPGFMAPFWPPSGLWFRFGSILALWFRFGLLDKSCAKQRRPRPEQSRGRRLLRKSYIKGACHFKIKSVK